MTIPIILLTWLMLILCVLPVWAEPEPGDIFREYTYLKRDLIGIRGEEVFFGEKAEGERYQAPAQSHLDIPDLEGAVKAELCVAYWGGHIGTSAERVRVNGHDWILLPQPKGTPSAPECYYRTLLANAAVDIPLAQLQAGENLFEFTASKQTCYGFNWSFYWIYSYTVRVYYGPDKPHLTGAIAAPAAGATVGDQPTLAASVSGTAGLQQVDFLAKCEDFNYEGDGDYYQWHYLLPYGRIERHAGTAVAAPYQVVWDNRWVPDQEKVALAARLVGRDGVITMTPAVTVTLTRPDRRVVMYKPSEVPENFGVRVGVRKSCQLEVADELHNAVSARLFLSTWSAAHAEEISFNGAKLCDRIGVDHNYSFDAIPVPVSLLAAGTNTFSLYSSTDEHAAEVNWPGPVLLVEYRK